MLWYQIIDSLELGGDVYVGPTLYGPMPALYWAITRGPAAWW